MDDIEFERLKSLGEGLVKAYTDSTHMQIIAAATQKYEKDANIQAILTDMERVLLANPDVAGEELLAQLGKGEKLIDYRTLYKILRPSREESDISPKNRKKINDYIFLIRRNSHRGPDVPVITYKGAYLIDEHFKQFKENLKGLKLLNFYTLKTNSDVQWAGVFKGYDIRQDVVDKLKNVAFQPFGRKNSKICAVLLGHSGSGKSTTLRRFATECIQNPKLKTIWIYNINEFNQSFADIRNIKQEYLLIIDDWNSVEKSPEAKWSFLNNLRECNNVKVVIGDYYSRADYEEFCYGGKFLKVNSGDNKEIVEQIVKKVEDEVPLWEGAHNDLLKINGAIFNAPLYMILFVIFKRYFSHKPANLDFDDFESQFKKIIRNDLNEISQEYPGLVKALYYWSHIYKEYNRRCTLQVLLKLADLYQSNQKATIDLISFSDKNPICDLLRHYISFEPFVHPLYEGQYLVIFNHDLLVDALSQPFNRNWHFDDDILCGVLSDLIDVNEVPVARDWYNSLLYKKAFDNYVPGNRESELAKFQREDQLRKNKRFQVVDDKINKLTRSYDMMLNELIKFYYEDIYDIDDSQWLRRLYYVSSFLKFDRDEKQIVIGKMAERLLNMGCNSNFLKYAKTQCETSISFRKLFGEMEKAYVLRDYSFLHLLVDSQINN